VAKEGATSPRQSIRMERDSLGGLPVPADALYGAQTERAVRNFPISGLTLPRAFIRALCLIKSACAQANLALQRLTLEVANAIIQASDQIMSGEFDDQFPIDVFQTGSGTSTHMNANEVIARLAHLQSTLSIHPNDHVNMSQSSNDVIPSTIHLSCALEINRHLLPALHHLKIIILQRSEEMKDIPKTGRTHLMDALPLTFGQELSGWAAQIQNGIHRIQNTLPRIHALALGGTAVGTGVNAEPEFTKRVIDILSERSGIPLTLQDNYFEGMSTQDSVVELSAQLRVLAVSLTKISNDLRWMNSGPLAGLAEIVLPAVQPGSSIMPGKINPVIPEAVLGACAQVMGNDTTIALGGLSGNFQLNTMLPVIAYNILQSIQLIGNSARVLADKAIAGFVLNEVQIERQLKRNPILVTALNPIIGYEKGAEIAKIAYQTGRSILEVAAEMTSLPIEDLKRLLDPKALTRNGTQNPIG